MCASASEPLSGAEDFLREIEILVDEIRRLSQSSVDPSEFYRQLLERAAFALNANDAAIWDIGSQGRIALMYQVGLERLRSKRGQTFYSLERDRLLPLVDSTQPTIVRAEPQTGLTTWVVAAPVLLEGQKHSLLTVYLDEDLPLAVKQGFLRFAQQLAQLASDFEERRISASWKQESRAWKRYAELSLTVNSAWSVQKVAYEIANEGRRYVGCDRVAVLLNKRRKSRARAISGVDAVHQHANVVRQLEQLVDVVLPLQQALFIEDQAEDLPPQIEIRLQRYLDETATRSMAIIPLFHQADQEAKKRSRPFGALVFEQFKEESLLSLGDRIHLLSEQAEISLSRATRISNVPLLGFLVEQPTLYAWLRVQTWPMWAVAMSVLSAVVAFLLLFPAEFDLVAHGELEPVRKQHVFATQDGTVTDVLVENNQHVAEGELLVQLSSTNLELEFQRTSGEMLVARKELSAIRAEQLQSDDFDANDIVKVQALSARELAIQEQLENLAAQLELLSEQREQLEVRSPLAGRIITWDISETLQARPVRRGDVMMTVADTEGDWVVQLRVADADMGHLLNAAADSEADLAVSFVEAADPTTVHQGTIHRVGEVSQVDPRGNANAVLVEVTIDSQSKPQLRAGASVVSKIHCGKRAIGFVWLRELLEEWDRHFF